MNGIDDSIFSVYKIGPGPSSSHTLGPMNAAWEFRRNCSGVGKGAGIRVRLYGSLSSTGKGHGTDAAILAGLLGNRPEDCPPVLLPELAGKPDAKHEFQIGKSRFFIALSDILFCGELPGARHPNTMDFELLSESGASLLTRRCCSVGGGEIRFEGSVAEKNAGVPPCPYHSLRRFRDMARRMGASPVEILLRNEETLFSRSREEIFSGLDRILDVMAEAVERGISAEGLLPGPLRVEREAGDFFRLSQQTNRGEFERDLLRLNAYALAASEENASGHLVVTAPTSGSAGVLPGVIRFLSEKYAVSREKLREGLVIAALFALVTRHNASISGAEVGCQGEIGVASAMAAALTAHVFGRELAVIENAAEIALEHHLGMTCDPIGGYVQIPCIERNAVSAVTAFNAAMLSSGNPSKHKLDYDAVVEVMLETGLDMNTRYKETATGGLAGCPLRC